MPASVPRSSKKPGVRPKEPRKAKPAGARAASPVYERPGDVLTCNEAQVDAMLSEGEST